MATTVNLAVLIFVLVLIAQVVTWVGKSALQELVFEAYAAAFLSRPRRDQRRLRKQVLEDKAELGRTSSQDQFAKWAKIKRRLDKGLADLELSNQAITSARTNFGRSFSTVLWVITTGAQFFLAWWFRRQPVFWLPAGWVPGPIEWILRFPSAPKGSVSVGAWSTVCKQALLTAAGIVNVILTPAPAAVPLASGQPTAAFEKPVGVSEKPPSARIEELEPEMLD